MQSGTKKQEDEKKNFYSFLKGKERRRNAFRGPQKNLEAVEVRLLLFLPHCSAAISGSPEIPGILSIRDGKKKIQTTPPTQGLTNSAAFFVLFFSHVRFPDGLESHCESPN